MKISDCHIFSNGEILHMRMLVLSIKNDINGIKYEQKTSDKLIVLGKMLFNHELKELIK